MDNIDQMTQVIANVGILTFVVASMAALGLSLSVGQIVGPLRNGRLVAMALLAAVGSDTIHSVTFDVSGDVIADSEAEMLMILACQ